MRIRLTAILSIAALLCLLLAPVAFGSESFSVKEYEKFHDVLEPLQHEALPNKNFGEIRLKAAELVKRGKAMIKLGVPAGTTKTEEFRQGLKTFKTALDQFSKDARSGNDTSLEKSFSAVHDSFEMLAGMLPRK